MEASLPLKNKWIVNTRAAHQAQPLTEKLRDAGATVINFPLLEIEAPENYEDVEQQLSALEQYDLAIFISTNAVERTLDKVDVSTLKKLKLACVGKKTGLALKKHGLDSDFCPERFFNSEALLALDAFQQFIPGKNIALIKGEGGRDLLQKSLLKWGGDVDSINVYRRTCPQHNLALLKNHQQRQELDIIILTSGFSIDHFFELADKHSETAVTNSNNKSNENNLMNSVTLLLGSERLKSHIPDSFKGKVIFAEDPNDDTLLKELTIDNKL
ncbi:uroporphyrinogen-III synthase [Cocleimonas sp. KMM 6892]|uniref:uroporphyrinogen-III synthase n=1 Tax=unclassified Cocleimonas TaxID=2639732 RepID=UPI002DB68EE8|nr:MULTISPECIES: uroporphyrinogen-III synthase [unclassified Cocleimonas]MEB8431548.1 uroporphyrinogen-III synthase [Cocleimonas sp. KMM 6892]MEC4713680.1 uroporphyrinogen-III synthase [Cocleimonas sp. KMM 6895]MEC4743011.1 uroporphyrinogen-III synthase [Cocleimonas sp. KMM 6896]